MMLHSEGNSVLCDHSVYVSQYYNACTAVEGRGTLSHCDIPVYQNLAPNFHLCEIRLQIATILQLYGAGFLTLDSNSDLSLGNATLKSFQL